MSLILERAASAARAAPRSAVPATRPAAAGARRVLLADPHADTVESTALLLRLWGHDVRCARSGSEALEAALAYRPDAVLMEMGLPGMDGCEVARRLRGHEGASQPLLVAVTGYGGERHRLLARRAGFDLHLLKPVCPELLRELLATSQRETGGQ
jgi:two-component system OmpR family response regulator